MSKLYILDGEPFFHCPGCGFDHRVNVNKPNPLNGAQWTWNGNSDAPTFSPSINVFPRDDSRRCHSFVRDGQIQYLGDCFHHLKGQTVPLPELTEFGDPITEEVP